MKTPARVFILGSLCATISLGAIPIGSSFRFVRALFSRGGIEAVEHEVKQIATDHADEVLLPIIIRETKNETGDKLLEVAPKLIVATGLGSSILYGTHELTSTPREIGRKIRDAPEENTIQMVLSQRESVWRLSLKWIFILALTLGTLRQILKLFFSRPIKKPTRHQ